VTETASCLPPRRRVAVKEYDTRLRVRSSVCDCVVVGHSCVWDLDDDAEDDLDGVAEGFGALQVFVRVMVSEGDNHSESDSEYEDVEV
jgi:hypothetical protein